MSENIRSGEIQVQPTPIPFCVKIGAVGHRLLSDETALRQRIREVFDRFLALVPHLPITPVRLSVFSPLAEGADRFIAQEALRREGAELTAVLPLEQSDYVEDFDTDDSRREFLGLLARSSRILRLRETPLPHDQEPEARQEARRQAYANVGRFVVDHCFALVAIWDGRPERGKGGTAAVIKYAREKHCPIFIIDSAAPHDITFVPGDMGWLRLARHFEAFNEGLAVSRGNSLYIANVHDELFDLAKRPEAGAIPAAARNLVRDRLIPYYVRASALAKSSQRLYQSVGLAVFTLSVVTIGSVAAGTVFWKGHPSAFIVEAVLLFTVLSLIGFADSRRSHKSWLEHRFLGEGLRSSMFLAACGRDMDFRSVPCREEDVTGEWPQMALEAIWSGLRGQLALPDAPPEAVAGFVFKAWVEDQLAYHQRVLGRNNRRSKRLELAGEATFFLALCASLIHLGLSYFSSAGHAPGEPDWLSFIALTLPAVGAACGGIRSHREYKRLARSSKRAVAHLKELRSRFPSSDLTQVDDLLAAMHRISMNEVHDWLGLMSLVELHKSV